MNKVGIIALSLIITFALGLSGCITVNPPVAPTTELAPAEETAPAPQAVPAGPEVPQEVLLIWRSAAPSGATPDLSGEVTLEPNKASVENQQSGDITFQVVATVGSHKNSEVFYLDEGQWADIVVSCPDMPIYYLSEQRGAAHLVICNWADPDKRGTATFEPDMGIFNPFYSKCLYENHITSTDKGPLFTTAVRLFAWNGAGEYFLWITNYSSEKGCQIKYQVYKRGSTPGWGRNFTDERLQPWLNELYELLVSGEISQEEYDRAESRWLEQFK